MPEDIKVKDDKALRVFDAIVDREFVSLEKKKVERIFGCTFREPEKVYGRQFAFNMKDGIQFDLPINMIKRLDYRNAFHKFILNNTSCQARHSYYYPGAPRIQAFLFTDHKDLKKVVEYFDKTFNPKRVMKNGNKLLEEAQQMLKMSQDRVDKIEKDITEAWYTLHPDRDTRIKDLSSKK